MKKLAAIILLGFVATCAYLAFCDPQQKWCYILQAYYWPKPLNERIAPPAGYRGLWRTWTQQGQIDRVAFYSAAGMEVEDWFVDGSPWMRVNHKGGSGAACGYEYRFSGTGEVTYVCMYLAEKPGEPIVVFDPNHRIDTRQRHPDIIYKYAPL